MDDNSLEAQRDEATKLVNEISEKSRLFENRLKESITILKELASSSEKGKRLNTSINSLITDTKTVVDSFKQERKTVTKHLNEVQTFYEAKFLPLQQQIENRKSGLQAKLTTSKKDIEDITKFKNLATEHFQEVKNHAAELRRKSKELVSIDNNIRKLWTNSKTNNENGLTLANSIREIEQQVKKTKSEVIELHKGSIETNRKIKTLLSDSETEVEIIKDNKTDSHAILSEIKKIYDLAAETGLSGEFERQKINLFTQMTKWEDRIFKISCFLLFGIVCLFWFELDLYNYDLKSMDVNFYLRFLIFSPVIYYLYFCAKEYSTTNRLYGKYTFKTTLAMSIQNHIKMLLDEEKFDIDARAKILDFVLNGFQKIYSEPFSDEDFKMRIKIQQLEMNMEKKLVEKFNELKGLADPAT